MIFTTTFTPSLFQLAHMRSGPTCKLLACVLAVDLRSLDAQCLKASHLVSERHKRRARQVLQNSHIFPWLHQNPDHSWSSEQYPTPSYTGDWTQSWPLRTTLRQWFTRYLSANAWLAQNEHCAVKAALWGEKIKTKTMKGPLHVIRLKSNTVINSVNNISLIFMLLSLFSDPYNRAAFKIN